MARQRQGHIISIASIVGVQGREGQANYSAAKAGLIGLTKACARELGRFDIKVNAVLPGYIPTDMGNKIADAVLNRVIKENTLGRVSEPDEVADFVYHLSLMNNVSGQVFNLDSRII
jgi:3-oxoacyl-[acyl-carrier protein] reductase